MTKFTSPLLAATAEVNERFKCSCENTELVCRTHKDGSEHFVLHCTKCGKTVHQAIPEARAYAINGGVKPPPLDQNRRKNWIAAKQQAMKEAEARARKPAEAEYDRYLASPQWAAKRQLVLKRAAGICEGCGLAKATDVHHTTYEHRYDEFLFELLALCHPCHERVHQDRTLSASE
jgi:hypothetical protein